MNEIIAMDIRRFALVYLLLVVVLIVMKKCHINQSKLLLVASFRMTIQLMLAGLVLTYIFEHPHPAFTVIYLLAMTGFAVHIMLGRNKGINRRFKVIAGVSLGVCGLAAVCFFIVVIVGMPLFHPRYTIPISGMILGNAVTGVSLGLKTFNERVKTERLRIETLLNTGATPKRILTPFVNGAVETALLPTLNSMLGMGIISLPGMMTGQILSGTMPMTAILYQISIIIAISAVCCMATFSSLFFGYRTLYNDRNQIVM